MPYNKVSELPENVKGLPEAAQKMWMSVFNSAYSGACKDEEDKDACAAKIAWSQVSKKYEKKENSLAEFSLSIHAATHNKPAGTLRWKASASDVFDDSLLDNMTAELFDDFTERIDRNEIAPEPFRSSFWQGGMPYLSVAHYNDLDGDGVPGTVEKIYMDGNYLKSTGEFNKNPLGLACYYSLCKDLYEHAETKSENDENPIRISIAFLDWKHRHKDDGTVFERKSLDDVCPKCLMEMITGEYSGKEYLKGQLIHLALTRSPVNKRTSINLEVEKSMTTQKEDAVSIVGEELADELESKKSEIVGRSQALVEMSETETEEPENKEVEVEVKSDTEKEVVVEDIKVTEEVEETKPEFDLVAELSELKELLRKESATEKKSHPMDEPFEKFKARYDEVIKSDLSAEDKLRTLQEPLDAVSKSIIDTIKGDEPETVEPQGDVQLLVKALSEVMSPISTKLDLLLDQKSVVKDDNYIPERRSITPGEAVTRSSTKDVSRISSSKTPKIRELVERSVGIVG